MVVDGHNKDETEYEDPSIRVSAGGGSCTIPFPTVNSCGQFISGAQDLCLINIK
jgi:hypothetical protein